jgi:hypothetical protein
MKKEILHSATPILLLAPVLAAAVFFFRILWLDEAYSAAMAAHDYGDIIRIVEQEVEPTRRSALVTADALPKNFSSGGNELVFSIDRLFHRRTLEVRKLTLRLFADRLGYASICEIPCNRWFVSCHLSVSRPAILFGPQGRSKKVS